MLRPTVRSRSLPLHRIVLFAPAIWLASGSFGRLDAQVTDVTWGNVSGQTDWLSGASWSGGIAPANDLTTNRAVLPSVATINAFPTITGTVNVAGIAINNGGADWIVQGGGVLNVGISGISMPATTGTAVVNVGYNALRTQNWNISSGSAIQLAGDVAVRANASKVGNGSLEVLGNLYGGATLTASAGTLRLAGVQNMFHGHLSYSGGTLTIDSPLTALRAAKLTVNNNMSASSALRIGELAGSSSLTLGGGNELRLTTLADATYTGSLTAGDVSVYGIGKQTITGTTSGVAGDVTVGRGATVEMSQTATFNAAGNDLVLRGGSFLLNNSSSPSNSRFNNSGVVTFTGGGKLQYTGPTAGSNESVGTLSVGYGQAEIGVISNATSNFTTLQFGSWNFNGWSTVNFFEQHLGTSSANELGGNGAAPHIILTGHTQSFIGGFATVNGVDFATYNSTFGVRAATATAFASAGTGSNAELTASEVYASSTTKDVQSLKIDVASAGQSLDIAGSGGLTFLGVLLAAGDTFTIRNTGGGTGNVLLTNDRYFHVFDGAQLTIATNVAGSSNSIVKGGSGTLVLTPRTTNTLGGLVINQGAVQGALGSGVPNNAVVRLRGGVLEVAGGGTLNKTLGVSSGNVNWADSGGAASGGFSAVGGKLTVDLQSAGASNLVWGQTNFVQNDYALTFGSSTSASDVEWVDNLALNQNNQTGYEARQIYVDGSSATPWRAILSGVVSSVAYGGTTNGQLTDLLKTGDGELELSGDNTYVGGTIVAEGTLVVSHTNALGDNSQSRAYVLVGDRDTSGVAGGLLLGAPITLARDLTVGAVGRLGGAFSGTSTFAGEIDLQGNVTLTSAAGGVTRFTGPIAGGGNVTVDGSGTIALAGLNTFSGAVTVVGGTLRVDADAPSGAAGALGNATSTITLDNASSPAGLVTGAAVTIGRNISVLAGNGTYTLGGAQTTGTSTFSGAVTIGRPVQFTSAANTVTLFSGNVTGTGSLIKADAGTVRLGGSANYSGATTVNAGVLEIAGTASGSSSTVVNGGTLKILSGGNYSTLGSLTVADGGAVRVEAGGTLATALQTAGVAVVNGTLSAPVTVNNLGILSGTGSVGTLTLRSGGTLSPGNSVGTLSVSGSNTSVWEAGSTVYFEFRNAVGSTPGLDWDLLDLSAGTLNIQATPADKIALRIDSWKADNSGHGGGTGDGANYNGFDPYGTYSWLFVKTGGLNPSYGDATWQTLFSIDSTAAGAGVFGAGNPFASVGGVFTVSQIGNDLYLNYSPVPEPGSCVLAALAAGAGVAYRRRRARARLTCSPPPDSRC